MIESLDAVTTALVQWGLDRAWARQQLIASNIANHATPGYAPLDLSFEAQLAPSMAVEGPGPSDRDVMAWIDEARQSTHVIQRDGSVELDREMVDLSENTLRYRALLAAVDRLGSLKSLAIQGGGR